MILTIDKDVENRKELKIKLKQDDQNNVRISYNDIDVAFIKHTNGEVGLFTLFDNEIFELNKVGVEINSRRISFS